MALNLEFENNVTPVGMLRHFSNFLLKYNIVSGYLYCKQENIFIDLNYKCFLNYFVIPTLTVCRAPNNPGNWEPALVSEIF